MIHAETYGSPSDEQLARFASLISSYEKIIEQILEAKAADSASGKD
jgi:hypothetical protein